MGADQFPSSPSAVGTGLMAGIQENLLAKKVAADGWASDQCAGTEEG